MSTTAISPSRVALDLIDIGENVRPLDQAHVDGLASSIALRGLIVPLVVRPNGERFTLIAGHHRYAACRSLGAQEVEISLREQEGSSADSAAENVARKQLSPLEEARAVQAMLDEGYTLDGAATVLGWSHALVTARAKILALPEIAQRLLGSGELPLSTVVVLTTIADVSPELCEAALAPVASGQITGGRFANNPGWAIGYGLSGAKVFADYLHTLHPSDIAVLRLGKKIEAAFAEAEELHKKLNPHSFGPPTIRFAESDVDQARAAGVLIEFDEGTPIITDRALYRELAKQAVTRRVEELRAAKKADDCDRASRRAKGNAQRTPQQKLDAEHRATMRRLTADAHGVNLDLGAALLQSLAAVDPADMDVARFFAYGLLGPDTLGYLAKRDHPAEAIAANGIRLVVGERRTTTTPRLKSGGLGKTKVAYGEVEDAAAWLWKFIDGAKSAGELYGRVLVVFASQHYANQLVLAASKRRSSALPCSRKGTARKAFERLTKTVLPASYAALERALEREARAYAKRQGELSAAARRERVPVQHDAEHDSDEHGPEDVIEA